MHTHVWRMLAINLVTVATWVAVIVINPTFRSLPEWLMLGGVTSLLLMTIVIPMYSVYVNFRTF